MEALHLAIQAILTHAKLDTPSDFSYFWRGLRRGQIGFGGVLSMQFGYVETAPVRHSDGVTRNYVGTFRSADGVLLDGYMKALGPQPLLRELLASALARLLRLRVPDVHLVICPPQVMSVPEALLAPPAAGREGRVLFATETAGVSYARHYPPLELDGFPTDVAATIFTEAAEHLATLLRGWKSLDTAILFDEWIANDDRNLGNFLLTDDGDICLIDHERAFGGQEVAFKELAPGRPATNNLLQWGYGAAGMDETRKRLETAFRAAAGLVEPPRVEAAADRSWELSGVSDDSDQPSDAVKFLLERWPLINDLLSEKLPLPFAVASASRRSGKDVHG